MTENMRICFVAHPDDDALWFGNTELLTGFDIKIILTYRADEIRAKECIEWTRLTERLCQLVFLGFVDDKKIIPTSNQIINTITQYDIPRKVRAVYTHGRAGEYGHPHHKAVREAALNYFNPEKFVVPHYPIRGQSAQYAISGPKHDLIKKSYRTQVSGLNLNLQDYCTMDYLDVESVDRD